MNQNLISVVTEVKRLIDNNLMQNCRVNELANMHGISKRKLTEYFKFVYKYSPGEYIKKRRIKVIDSAIQKHGINVSKQTSNIALSIGYTSSSGLYKFIKRETGMDFVDYINHMLN